MSLPVQLPLLNPKQANPAPDSKKVDAVDPAQPAKSKTKEDFDQAMKSADQAQAKEATEAKGESKVAKSEEASAEEAGKSLPGEEMSAETSGPVLAGTDTVVFEDETLKLQLGLNQFQSTEQVDDAVLLATRFVVDSLPNAVKETATELSLTGNLNAGKPDLLVKLQAQLNPTQSGQNPIQLNLDSVALGSLKELGEAKQQSSTVTSAAALESAANQTSAANELRATALTGKPEMVVPNRVGSEGWSEAMAGRINLLVNQRISAARIHINPPELGPIEVRVNVNHDQASVQFTSQSAQVRDALEQSIPRLRDMLESAGFSLADSDVNDQGSGDGSGDSEGEEAPEMAEDVRTDSLRRESLGLVDQYV